MIRMNLVVAGLALAVGIALAWGGAVRPRDTAGKTQDILEQVRLREAALVEEIKGLRQDVNVLKASLCQAGSASHVKDAPAGRITNIDPADSTLVEVDLGAEAGLEKHAALEVFRTGAGQEYVGALRIFEVYSRRAVCRLVSTNPLTRPTVHVGDGVRCQRN